MKLDEALYYRWAGKEIKRKHWSTPLGQTGFNVDVISTESIDADDWEVVPDYVDFDAAWAALDKNKGFVAAGGGPYIRIDENTIRNKASGADLKSIPIWWLNYKKFEIVENTND